MVDVLSRYSYKLLPLWLRREQADVTTDTNILGFETPRSCTLPAKASTRPARAEPAIWTPARDAALRAARADGLRWQDVAERIGVSRWSAVERGRKLGVPRPLAVPPPVAEDPSRPPLPAGHPRSWGALIAGTLLDGTPYPMPVFR